MSTVKSGPKKRASASRKPASRKPASRSRRTAPKPRKNGSFRTPQRGQKSFGRRGQAPTGFGARVAAFLNASRLFAVTAVLLLTFAVGWGLHAGGHIAALGVAVVEQSKGAVAALGLRVDEVTVEGRTRTEAADVLNALGATRGQFIFDVDLVAARDRLERLEWVERATVSRHLPGTVHVQLMEREPYAVWQRGGRLSLVDRTGSLITDNNLSAFAHLPLVVGHGAQRNASSLMKELMAKPALAARVQAAVRVSDRRWNLKLQNGIEVRLPARGISDSLRKLVRMDAKNGVLSRNIRAVDLRVPGRITILVDSESAAQRRAAFQARSEEGGRDA